MHIYWLRSVRRGEPLSVAFFDLDHFKVINDAYGHDAGDQVLCQFTQLLGATVREQDLLVRWGGEEFVLLLEAKRADAYEILQRLQAKGFGLRPDGGPLTASVGLAEREADCASSMEKLIELADQRMYRAKRAGRNRICVS